MADMTPRQIVQELDRYIVGQDAAKRAVAVAIRNRWRRQQLPPELRKDVTPKNIIMIGPTGVGKTEIARRLAQLVGAPFLKVEATKYTEVGYHGRDVESMIRDLTEIAVGMVRQEQRAARRDAGPRARHRTAARPALAAGRATGTPENAEENERQQRTPREDEGPAGGRRTGRPHGRTERRAEGGARCRSSPTSAWSRWTSISRACSSGSCRSRRSSGRSRSARPGAILLEQETEALIDRQVVSEKAVELVENQGIVFIDELDKVCGPQSSHGPDVSRQGVQRDLLPVVEGTTVNTRYGPVRTDHILFIAAGAFHARSRPT